MSAMNDGGPAFPLSVHPEHGYGPAASVEAGMSLRDWFAGMALQGLASAHNDDGEWTGTAPISAAAEAYALADAMLAQREKP